MYKKLLVPLDGSLRAKLAAEHAQELATSMTSEILLFHVIPALPPYVNNNSDRLGGAYQQIHDELLANGNKIMEQAKEEFEKRGLVLSIKVLWGNPAMEICREAKEGKFDLIVMGSRGLGEIKGYLMGSVSNRVVKHACCPVLIVR